MAPLMVAAPYVRSYNTHRPDRNIANQPTTPASLPCRCSSSVQQPDSPDAATPCCCCFVLGPGSQPATPRYYLSFLRGAPLSWGYTSYALHPLSRSPGAVGPTAWPASGSPAAAKPCCLLLPLALAWVESEPLYGPLMAPRLSPSAVAAPDFNPPAAAAAACPCCPCPRWLPGSPHKALTTQARTRRNCVELRSPPARRKGRLVAPAAPAGCPAPHTSPPLHPPPCHCAPPQSTSGSPAADRSVLVPLSPLGPPSQPAALLPPCSSVCQRQPPRRPLPLLPLPPLGPRLEAHPAQPPFFVVPAQRDAVVLLDHVPLLQLVKQLQPLGTCPVICIGGRGRGGQKLMGRSADSRTNALIISTRASRVPV